MRAVPDVKGILSALYGRIGPPKTLPKASHETAQNNTKPAQRFAVTACTDGASNFDNFCCFVLAPSKLCDRHGGRADCGGTV